VLGSSGLFESVLKLQSEERSWRKRDGRSLHGVPDKIGAVASILAASRRKRPRANAAQAKIAGRDLIGAPPLSRGS
jgi:hypothetical protein